MSSGSIIREGTLRMAFVPLSGAQGKLKWRSFWCSLQHNALQQRHNVLFFDKPKVTTKKKKKKKKKKYSGCVFESSV
jgi:hypothetical protein